MNTKELKALTDMHNRLFDNMPAGDVNVFDVITVIKNHMQELSAFIDDARLTELDNEREVQAKYRSGYRDGWRDAFDHITNK